MDNYERYGEMIFTNDEAQSIEGKIKQHSQIDPIFVSS
jgi:hypothetical protein